MRGLDKHNRYLTIQVISKYKNNNCIYVQPFIFRCLLAIIRSHDIIKKTILGYIITYKTKIKTEKMRPGQPIDQLSCGALNQRTRDSGVSCCMQPLPIVAACHWMQRLCSSPGTHQQIFPSIVAQVNQLVCEVKSIQLILLCLLLDSWPCGLPPPCSAVGLNSYLG